MWMGTLGDRFFAGDGRLAARKHDPAACKGLKGDEWFDYKVAIIRRTGFSRISVGTQIEMDITLKAEMIDTNGLRFDDTDF